MNMREQMARNMFAASATRMKSTKTWETAEQAYRDLMFAEVDAALQTLESPTEGMCRALYSVTYVLLSEAELGIQAVIRAVKEGK